MDFESFFSEEALELAKWALEENDRIKSSKLYKIACKLEYHFRKCHGIRLDCDVYFNGYFSTVAMPALLPSKPQKG